MTCWSTFFTKHFIETHFCRNIVDFSWSLMMIVWDNVLPVVHYLIFVWGSTLLHMKIISKYQILERCVIKQYFQYLKWFSPKKSISMSCGNVKLGKVDFFSCFLLFFRKTSLTEAILNERSEHYLGIISRSFPSHFTKKIFKIPNMVGVRGSQTWLVFWDNVLPVGILCSCSFLLNRTNYKTANNGISLPHNTKFAQTLKFVESPKNVWFSGQNLHSVGDNVLPVGILSFSTHSKTEGSTKKILMIWNCLTSILFNLKVKLIKIQYLLLIASIAKNQAMPFFTSKFTQLYV